MTTSTISAGLKNFFEAELANEESMRRELVPGSDEFVESYEPGNDLYIPDSSLGTALDSWMQAPDDVRADLTGMRRIVGGERELSASELHAIADKIAQGLADVEAELRALIADRGEDTLLRDLI